jgi:hypothetical protein
MGPSGFIMYRFYLAIYNVCDVLHLHWRIPMKTSQKLLDKEQYSENAVN